MKQMWWIAACAWMISCGAAPEADQTADAEDACGLCATGKADGWQAPEAGSCEALAMLEVANTLSFEELDARLNVRAVRGIVDAREDAPIETLKALDAVKFVGTAALRTIESMSIDLGLTDACGIPSMFELQLISDIDKTLLPPNSEEPYPGVVTLYEILELGPGGMGRPGDTTYVTARQPERVVEIPAWFAEHGLPEGDIETGISGIPGVAQGEKIRDITKILAASEARQYVMFGDSSHRDPEAYRGAIEAHPDHDITALIHRVTEDEPDERFEGVHVYENYAHAAAILVEQGLLTEEDAWRVFDAAVAEGLEVTREEMRAWLP